MKVGRWFLPVLVFALQAVANVPLVSVPPACLLQAVNTQDNPSDLSAICGDEATAVQMAIASLCGNNRSVAQSAFMSTCSAAGSSVAPYTATSKGASPTSEGAFVYTTAVYESDYDCTTTIVTSATGGAAPASDVTATIGGSGSETISATNTAGDSSATGNSAADAKQVGSFAAAVIAIAGVVAVL